MAGISPQDLSRPDLGQGLRCEHEKDLFLDLPGKWCYMIIQVIDYGTKLSTKVINISTMECIWPTFCCSIPGGKTLEALN